MQKSQIFKTPPLVLIIKGLAARFSFILIVTPQKKPCGPRFAK